MGLEKKRTKSSLSQRRKCTLKGTGIMRMPKTVVRRGISYFLEWMWGCCKRIDTLLPTLQADAHFSWGILPARPESLHLSLPSVFPTLGSWLCIIINNCNGFISVIILFFSLFEYAFSRHQRCFLPATRNSPQSFLATCAKGKPVGPGRPDANGTQQTGRWSPNPTGFSKLGVK